jgi:hypothetical protein
MQRILKSVIPLTACLLFALGTMARAEDKKIDPTGAWTSSYTNQNDQVRTTTINLKLEGEKLTGTVSGRNGDTAIENASLKGDELSFVVNREFGGNKVTIKYNGKITGDTIKGKSEFARDGQSQSRDWEAKREVAKAKESEPK